MGFDNIFISFRLIKEVLMYDNAAEILTFVNKYSYSSKHSHQIR